MSCCCRWAAPMLPAITTPGSARSEEHTSELQSHSDLVCRLLLEKKKTLPYYDRCASMIAQRKLAALFSALAVGFLTSSGSAIAVPALAVAAHGYPVLCAINGTHY